MAKTKNDKPQLFKKGCIPYNKGARISRESQIDSKEKCTVRLDKKMYDKVCHTPEGLPVDGSSSYRFLRPKKETSTEPTSRKDEISTNRIVCINKTMALFNDANKGHRMKSDQCQGQLEWDYKTEKSWGLGCRVRLLCNRCQYRSSMHSLYEEVETPVGTKGRKAAKMNRGVHVGQSQAPISSTSLRRILSSANVKAPSHWGMQKQANKVCDTIASTNQRDLRSRRKTLREINKLRGRPEHLIDLAVDGTYNNSLYSGGGHTPFQAGTQCVQLAAETVTKDKDIVAMATKSKLCNIQPTCENEHQSTCKGNLPIGSSIGNERAWSREILDDILQDGLEVDKLVTDPDTKAYKAAEELFQSGRSSTQPRHFLDTTHVARNQRKSLRKLTSLAPMMPGTTRHEREKQKDRFSADLANRCQAEMSAMYKLHTGDTEQLQTSARRAREAIKLCYRGIHTSCKRKSLVCNGDWLEKSSYLDSDFKIAKGIKNDHIIDECLDLRLGDNIIAKTTHNLNTQKVESANRRIKRSLPKSMNFTRNFDGRAHSAVHCINHGPGHSISKLCEAVGSPISKGSSVARNLENDQKHYRYWKEKAQSLTCKKKRAEKRRKLYQLHDCKVDEDIYVSNQLLKSIKANQKDKT